MSDKEAATWLMFKTQAQTGTDGQPKKKAKKAASSAEQTATRAVTEQASTPAVAASGYFTGGGIAWIVVLIPVGLFVMWLLAKLLGKNPNETSAPARPAPARASFSIPHCNYQKTADGFIVTFNKASLYAHGQFDKTSIRENKASLGGLLLGTAAAAFSSTTKIEVTKDAVIIDGYAMAREDFGGFHYTEYAVDRKTYLRLTYSFGYESKEIGGGWEPREGQEFTSALNKYLRATPQTGDEHQPSPEQLRVTARPKEF